MNPNYSLSSMSFYEKSNLIQLLAVSASFLGSLWKSIAMMSAGVTDLPAYLPVFAVSVGLLTLVLVVGHILIAALNPSEAGDHDERDRLIDWRSSAMASAALALGVVVALIGLFASWASVWTALILVHTLFIAELAKLGFRLFFYRRGV